MKTNYRIKTNFIYNLLYEIVRVVVPIITTPYISRILSPEGIGEVTLAQTYAQYFVIFSNFGFTTYGTRELAKKRNEMQEFRKLFWDIFFARLAFWFVALCAYVWYFYGYKTNASLSDKIFVIFIVSSLMDFSYYFRALENFKTVAIRNTTIKVLCTILIFLLIRKSSHVWLYAIILVMSDLVGQIVMVCDIDKEMYPIHKPKIRDIKNHILVAFTLFIPTIAIQIYSLLDKVMLGHLCGKAETAYYEYSQKLVYIAASVSTVLANTNVPRMAYYYEHDKSKFEAQFHKVFDFVNFIGIPMCMGIIGIAKNFSAWYYGQQFLGIQKLLGVNAFLVIILGWKGTIGSMVLIPMGKQKYYTMAVYVEAAINIVFNCFLIPQSGALGAIIASIVSGTISALLMLLFCNRFVNTNRMFTNIYKYILVSMIMLVCIKLIDAKMAIGIFSTVVEIVVGVTIYMGCMIVIRNSNAIEMLKYVYERIVKR